MSVSYSHSNSSMSPSLLTSLKLSSSQNNLSNAFTTFSLLLLQQQQQQQQTNNNHPSSSHLLSESLPPLFACCSRINAVPQGKQLHAYAISSGFETSPLLVPSLATFYSTSNLLPDAYLVTETSNVLHPLPWNIVISSYVRAGFREKGLSVYRRMLQKGIIPDNFTYPSVLKACAEEFDLGFGREVHGSIVKAGLGWNLFVHNALVFMYAKCGDLNVARKLFDEMPQRDSVSWNSIISGYASSGMWREAFEVFDRMRDENVPVNMIIWNTIAGGYMKTGKYKQVLDLITRLKVSESGGEWDPVAVINGLGACSHMGLANKGKEIHGLAIRTCCHEYDNVKNALITMYSRCKDLKHAHIAFRLVENRSVITWNSVISGFAHLDCVEEATCLFRELLVSDLKPNYVTIASILSVCARVANLQHGKEFHCYITKRDEFQDYLLLFNSLIEMYARSGKISLAKRLFDSLTTRDEVTYTSLITGYGVQGDGQTAVDLFHQMVRSNIKPDHVTMVAVLSACSHSALVTQGETLFNKMCSEFRIAPRLEHFGCMVDLYGRAGLLVRTKEIMLRMPYEPTPAMWATVIGGCRIHGEKELGLFAGRKLLEMRPQSSGYYVLVGNLYAEYGCWEELAKVRVLMRELGVNKVPGCAWVDVGSGFVEFLVADVKAFEMYDMLDGLSKQLKEAGYIMSYDTDENMR